jgi:hypothetical protein
MRNHCILLYRGPLERSRLSFIIDSLLLAYSDIDLIWIAPKYDASRAKYFEEFIKDYKIRNTHVIHHKAHELYKTLSELKKIFTSAGTHDLAIVGFSAVYYTFAFKADIKYWFINGIPEEKQMHGNRLIASSVVRLQWIVSRMLFRPCLIITVSGRMSGYVQKYFAHTEIFSAPTCVDTNTFTLNLGKPKNKKLFVYLGSGAPWQAMDFLASVWGSIHAKDPSIHFRVISRDERCKVLARNIVQENIEFVSAQTFDVVAQYLAEAQVGFLIREPHVVNEVSFPTKLGEYIASGLWVVTSNLDWDIADFIRKHQVGYLIEPTVNMETVATDILKAYESALQDTNLVERLKESRIELDRTHWAKLLSLKLVEIASNNTR